MIRWFRFYAEAMRNPKVLRLSDKDFRLWVGLMAIASENGGKIPHDNDLKLVLGMRLDHLKGGLNRLIRGGLIDAIDDGYEPHQWNKYQYKSDTSTDRVQKHREKRNVSVTPPDTDTDTDTEKEDKSSSSKCVRAQKPQIEIPDWIPPEPWAGWIEMRRLKHAKPSPHAIRLAIGELEKLRRDGHDPGAVLDQSTLKNWTGLFPIKEQSNGKRPDNDGLGRTGRAMLAVENQLRQAGHH